MSPDRPFVWSNQREDGARLVAEDRQTDAAIAASLGITKRQLERWKRHPDFQRRVREIVRAEREAILARGIAERQNRLDAMDERHQRLSLIFQERAQEPEMRKVPGGKGGFLVRRFKQIGTGPDATLVEEYEADVGLSRELRELEKQAAQELGQWTEKRDLTSGGKPIEFTIEIDSRRGEADE